ncbi:MAG: ion channel [Phaeodactylibacter sp.]|uniref:ion channel n=1 Tax=Phaeodactylibacter sp. TaxID=1940289 RepID=UPI0032ED1035
MKLRDLTSSLTGRASQSENDLGFGSGITSGEDRLINRDGSYNILRRGGKAWRPYQVLVEMSWWRFFVLITGIYVVVNALFAAIYLMIGLEYLSGAQPANTLTGDFFVAFFFSVQTFTTVGYGAISPTGIAANIVASIDALVGLMGFALATGLFFARFAQPQSSILFSKKAVIRSYQDTPYQSFQFQIVNQRNNKLINLSAKVSMSWVAEDEKGRKVRRFTLLELEREKVFLFPLNWILVHIIDKDSPLWQKTPEELEAMQPEFLVLLQGYDETFAQDIHANSSYIFPDLTWGKKFRRMYFQEDGHTVLELDWIDELEEEA